MSNKLNDYLAKAYGQTNINRLPAHARRICVDDYGPHDHSPPFCHINAHVKDDDDSFDLVLEHVPTNAAVLELVDEVRGEITDNGLSKDIRLHLYASQGPYIRRLAQAIRKVVARGAKYQNRNWKWIAPRTAASLEKLAAHLKQYERRRKAGTLPTYPPAPPTATVVATGKASTTRQRKHRAVPTEDDDEENLFKICGVE